MKNSIFKALIVVLLLACQNKENDTEDQELTHDQVTTNFRTPENEPGLDYSSVDSLSDQSEFYQDHLGRLPFTLREKIQKDPKYSSREISNIDSAFNGNRKLYQITFKGDTKIYRFDSKGELLKD